MSTNVILTNMKMKIPVKLISENTYKKLQLKKILVIIQ
jgi:hypothetical protein